MVAGLPLQRFYAVLRFISGWMFTDDGKDFGFRHTVLKSRKPFVHLTADERQ